MRKGIPIHVTRANHEGYIGTWRVNIYAGVVILWLATLNALVWGVVGLVVAARVLL